MAPLNVSENWSHPEAVHSLSTHESCIGRGGPQTVQTSHAPPLCLACAWPLRALIPPGVLTDDTKGERGTLQG